MIAAPNSGSGKTTITLGILRALRNRGVSIGPAKAGPDFIDPAFHTAASGQVCVNLDPWAMRPNLLHKLADSQVEKGSLLVEAMMGLFDGAADGTGSAADLAVMLELPVVLVVACARQSHSVAALVSGFRSFRASVVIAGVILNRVGSQRHEVMMREAMDAISVPVLGCVYRSDELELPSRHLGLVQADEHADLESFLECAAETMEQSVEIEKLLNLGGISTAFAEPVFPIPPLGQQICIAQDKAFRFLYPHLLKGWKDQGAEVSFFSPLENEMPTKDCDAIFLPGGYPELHAETLSQNEEFFAGLKRAADRGAIIYGECGGYMVLGEGLIDANCTRHKMANLLPLCTSFEKRKLQLGYRVATCLTKTPIGTSGSRLSAHEFHYSTIVDTADLDGTSVQPLFDVSDARGTQLGSVGIHSGNVMGSYMHIIDRRN